MQTFAVVLFHGHAIFKNINEINIGLLNGIVQYPDQFGELLAAKELYIHLLGSVASVFMLSKTRRLQPSCIYEAFTLRITRFFDDNKPCVIRVLRVSVGLVIIPHTFRHEKHYPCVEVAFGRYWSVLLEYKTSQSLGFWWLKTTFINWYASHVFATAMFIQVIARLIGARVLYSVMSSYCQQKFRSTDSFRKWHSNVVCERSGICSEINVQILTDRPGVGIMLVLTFQTIYIYIYIYILYIFISIQHLWYGTGSHVTPHHHDR